MFDRFCDRKLTRERSCDYSLSSVFKVIDDANSREVESSTGEEDSSLLEGICESRRFSSLDFFFALQESLDWSSALREIREGEAEWV